MNRCGRFLASVWVAAVVVSLVSCGSDGTKRQAVSGVITWRGQPLDSGAIVFLAEDPALGSGGGAMIINGAYSIPVTHGLLPGRYKVTVSSGDPKKALDPNADPGAPGPVYKDRISPRYNTQTTLTADVKAGGPNTFNFEAQ